MRIWLFSFLFVLVAWASPAYAQICVQLDGARDALSEVEQRSGVIALADTFAGEGQQVVDAPCDDVYVLYHIKLGNSVTVFVSGSKGRRRLQVGSLEEIPSAYSQIVRSLISGVKLADKDVKTRDNVTDRQRDPNRVAADSLIYVGVGPGQIIGGREIFAVDPSIAIGYRYELDKFGLDISFRGGGHSEEEPDVSGPDGFRSASPPPERRGHSSSDWDEDEDGRGRNLSDTTTLNIRGLYFDDPRANSSLYYGAGMGIGGAAFVRHGNEWSGSGVLGSTAVGFEFMRASTIRFFVEASLLLPFFTATDDFGHERWVPVGSIVLGGAWWTNRDRGCL